MKQYELETGIIGFVEVDEFAYDLSIKKTTEGKPDQLHYYVPEIFQSTNQRLVVLEQGNWQPLSLFSQLKEEDVKEVMPFKEITDFIQKIDHPLKQFFDYEFNSYMHDTALEAIHSLAQHLGLDTTQPIFVIFKPR